MTATPELEWTEYKSRFRAMTDYGTYWIETSPSGSGYLLICGQNPCCEVFLSIQDAQIYAQQIHNHPVERKVFFGHTDVGQAPYQDHTHVNLTDLLRSCEILLTGENLPERVAVQTTDLRTLLVAAQTIAPDTKPVDVVSWAQDLLTAWDQWYSCRQRDDATKALSEKLILAACFAGTAYDAAMSAPFFQDNAPEFLLRIFLIALIDQNSPELDPYRAKNRPQTTTLTDEGTKPVDVADADGSMTAEEIRLENLKQMAMYDGAIVSFETRAPYYLASRDSCGWVGSSELCGTDSYGDDSDVYCPRCHSSGADCGSVAERINCQPVDVAAVRRQALDEVKSLCAEYGNDSQPDSEYRLACNDLIEAICALSAEPAQGEQLPQDVINLVIAGRELVYSGEVTVGSHEAKALDKALEAFASRIPWENEPDELSSSTSEAGK